MIDLYCEYFVQLPKQITLDINDTFDAVLRGGQQVSLFQCALRSRRAGSGLDAN